MDINEVKVVWEKVKDELEANLPDHIFCTWITPLEAVDYENGTLVLLSPHPMAVDILKKNWTDKIKESVRQILGDDSTFSLTYDADFADRYIKARKKELSKIVAGQTEEERKTEEAKMSLAQMQSSANLNLNLKFDNFVVGDKKELSKIVAGQTEEERKTEEAKMSLAQMQSSANLNLNLKFDNFVVGDNAKFAYNAAFSVANNPSKKFNPLFIYGASGLGKTHLMQAIGHYIIFNRSDLKVRYIRMEDYFNEWVRCFQYNELPNGKKRQTCNNSLMRKFHQKFQNVDILLMDDIQFIESKMKTMEDFFSTFEAKRQTCNNSLMRKFHQKFQNVDILLMDDIQFIESKMKTMEDFFSTFEALYTNNKQIVIASDRLPKDIPTLDNRLRTRFEMGLVVDIVPPDFDTRFEIVKAYAKELEVEADDDVFEYIADNFVNNVRELKGAFNKVSAYAEFSGVGVTLELAKKALNCEVRKKEITVDIVAQKTADYFDLTVKDLKSTARQQKIAHARHVAVYLAREVLQMSYESIGEFFSKKHTTIMYSCDMIADKIGIDNSLQIEVEEIKASLRG